ncbi:MAG: hypothetical protein U9Q81_04410 [Pseudomonadota bacterium]|nr:hypothetical protein [Pseudomonadota bacterium]
MTSDLVGLDVGLSATKKSSGVARLASGNLIVGRATASSESRIRVLGNATKARVAAIDAPLVAAGNWENRACEYLFIRGAFQKRFKPGLSHVQGTGRELRSAGYDSARQLAPFTSGHDLTVLFPRVWKDKNLVEAFPNAFLGVMLPEERLLLSAAVGLLASVGPERVGHPAPTGRGSRDLGQWKNAWRI